ncbi:MAG: hypothetical protein ABIT01_13275, partial [Thermoanaerobaculia bacterium]
MFWKTTGHPRARCLTTTVVGFLLLASHSVHAASAPAPAKVAPLAATLTNPILFVTQIPIPADFTAVASVFGNQRSDMDSVGRGGDLWIRYPDGTLKNLTATAGYGNSGQQGSTSIAVRQPSVHWSGTKALFSMVIGAPTQQYVYLTFYWQIYEITGLGKNETPVITRVVGQAPNYNNVSPIYGTDDKIIFTSDRPRGGEAHLYPQLDEYEEAATVTGLWSLDRTNGLLSLMNHTPSGVFTPTIDSFGRVIFTRWDHLQRDQQADTDFGVPGDGTYGTFNYASEAVGAARLNDRTEIYPEPRAVRTDLLAGTNLTGHSFNLFFPWQINEDGTEEETVNHIGRHELHNYFERVFTDDNALQDFSTPGAALNQNRINNFLEIKEDPSVPGRYFGIDAPEFYTHAAGQVIAINGAPTLNADQMAITYYTDRSTAGFVEAGDPIPPQHSGHYRDPLPLADGQLVAVHSAQVGLDYNTGTRENPVSRYDFRMKTLKQVAGVWVPDQALTSGITKSVTYFDPDYLVTYTNVVMWELDPVEVRARVKPAQRQPAIDPVEQGVFDQEGVDVNALRSYLRANKLALIISRNVTTRERGDKQQPYNLKVVGSATQTIGSAGQLYQVGHMQFFQADQIRGVGGTANPEAGRRVLAQIMHDPNVKNPPNPTGPVGSVKIASDGSMAAFVPSRRAMSWQLTDAAAVPVVRERFWLTFQPGEIRTCTSCHGLNTSNQANPPQPPPTNPPLALNLLLQYWKANQPVFPTQLGFYPVIPCRVADTRNAPGPAGGPALPANGSRTFAVAGSCGVPALARAVTGNVTVVSPAAPGDLRLYAG